MKIFYLITKSEPGGAQTHVYQLSKYFIEKGNQVAIMSYPGGWLEKETKNTEIEFYPNKYFSNIPNPFTIFKAMKEIKRVIKDFEPDLIACHSTAAGFFGRLIIRNKIPTVFTAHGWAFTKGTPFLRKIIAIIIEKIGAKFCSKIICVSNFDKNLVLKYKIAPIEKIEVVHNGVNFQDYQFQKNDKQSIVFIGRLAKPKNPLLLLKAFNNLSPELKNKTNISIIGKGPKLRRLKKFIKIKGLNQVSLLGSIPRKEVFEILKRSDIFALISSWEGFPYTIIEAMSCGLPVIASDVGGIREAIDNKSGILVKRGDQKQIELALEKLLKNPSLVKEMGENAREKSRNEFSLDKMLKKTEQVYMHLLRP